MWSGEAGLLEGVLGEGVVEVDVLELGLAVEYLAGF